MASGAIRTAGYAFSQALRLGGNLLLTRLLAPEAFGVMAIVQAVQTGLQMATDLGVRQSVTRSDRGDDPDFVRTAWTMTIAKHVAVSMLLVLCASGLAVMAASVDLSGSIYGAPELPGLLAFTAIAMILRGCISANGWVGERRLVVAPLVITETAGQATGLVAMVLFAWIDRSVWALVYGGLVGAVAQLVLSHLIIPGPRMALRWRRVDVAEIWRFGRWLIGSSMLGFVARMGDRLILAALLPPLVFSYYAIARIWIDTAANAVQRVSRPVSLAALSEQARERPHALPRTFARLRLAQGTLCAAGFLFFLFAGRPFIDLLYTQTYAEVGALVVVLSPLILLKAYVPLDELLLSMGRSRSIATVALIRCLTLVGLLPLAWLTGDPRWMYLVVVVNDAWGVPRQLRLAAESVPLNMRAEWAALAALLAVAVAITLTA